MYLVSAHQMQKMDHQTITEFGIPGSVLMETAGRGAVAFMHQTWPGLETQRIAVLAGRGNNGGDGAVMARCLLEKKINVHLFLLSTIDRVKGDARQNLDLFQKMCQARGENRITEIPDETGLFQHRQQIVHHDLFVDAIFGTGLNADVKGHYKEAIDLLNATGRPVFSVDIPSGLNADTGQPMGVAVKAHATATFAFAKTGHILFPGNRYTGNLNIVDIGIPGFIADQAGLYLSLMEKNDIADLLPARAFDAHKGRFGHLLVIAGSTGKSGAAMLCSTAAMRCGTGLVTLGLPGSLNKYVEPCLIEPMTVPLPETKPKGHLSEKSFEEIMGLMQGKTALAAGPGIGTQKSTQALMRRLVEQVRLPMVLDADALNCLADDPDIFQRRQAPLILTPHPGEMARLCGITTAGVQADRIGIAADFARQYQVIVVLKGAQTLVSFPDGQTCICPTGNPGMASGGMGDVLTGIIAGFCAQGLSPENAAICGVYLHGLCADILSQEIGAFGFVASDMVTHFPRMIHEHLR